MTNPRIALVGATLAAAVLATGAHSEGVRVRWMGDVSCGSWRSAGKYNEYPKVIAVNWVLGYLARAANADDTDLLGTVDQASVAAWMDNYCQANPLKQILEGATDLERELVARLKPAGALAAPPPYPRAKKR